MNIGIRLDGDKIILDNLQGLINDYPAAVKRGMRRSVDGIYERAQHWLSGGGGNNAKTRISKKQIKKEGLRTGFTKMAIHKQFMVSERVNFKLWKDSGRYPVPQRTSNLLRLLNFVYPGYSKTGKDGLTFKAESWEAIIYDSAEYARVIHEGTGSSSKFGPRRFLTDALEQFNQGNRIAETVAEEIQKDIKKRGMA